MSKSTLISIPVRKHVKEFLLQEFGLPGENFIRIHQNTFLGKTIVMAVDKLPYRQLKTKKEKSGNVAEISLQLPKALKHYAMTEDNMKALSDFFEKYFQQQLLFFVKGQVARTGNELAAITMFMNLYQIDTESYDLEVARKCWRDYKDRIYKVNQMVAHQPAGFTGMAYA
ncbi:hypothetical protein [Adhaeribacter pallidiroseus]|uniref:Uncharacterized protein n=1 Tax=Adhaeribacter pallidiroseus TaxID=2072847 RepID=A0A369QJ91_9BACT|nr:hypothetical protein [Adhaeribacter pallidiroseus]RDC63296.1 hypothetical protein AHMF7616_01898 [Adhaeribacter pallidiroseus]